MHADERLRGTYGALRRPRLMLTLGGQMAVEDVKRGLDAAREELSAATAALSGETLETGGWTRYQTAYDKCISLERDLARATGEECAVESPGSILGMSAPRSPHLFSSGSRTFVVYNIRESDPTWDGSYATVVDQPAPTFA